ncbi:Wzy polymerase domain-containing protein [Chromobacterium vaccinii]|uniref:PglL family O-oligosaccharyltransferase n=1 Tax=Chromobacterium vaccinii TaxID=1108595 RepID=UPI001E426082|nr:Wzy polymerase domain-containing protein [Chromobacterium vaccinii]
MSILFLFLFTFPFLNFARYSPLQDWWTDAFVIAGCGLAGLLALRNVNHVLILPRVALVLVVLLLQWSLLSVVLYQNFLFSIPAIGAFLAMLLLSLYFANGVTLSRARLCILLAGSIVFGASVQIVLGYVQVFGLAPYFHGWILFDVNAPTSLLGNVGQRNQYAQYLGWAIPSACLLYAYRRLRGYFCFSILLLCELLMTWTGARLVLVYGLALALLAWFWHRRERDDPIQKRMVRALALAIILLALLQLFSHDLMRALNSVGLGLQFQSGSERMLDAGFGARRRLEWTKAWQVFQSHPWLGGGFGSYAAQSAWLEVFAGLPKYPESWLFTHCHNLVFQLLAETGILGTVTILGGMLWCLYPYFGRGRQSAENLMLVSIAAMVLIHSQFEFPLWYMPFLGLLILVCALSPVELIEVPMQSRLTKYVSMLIAGLMLLHVCSGAFIFSRLIRYNYPTGSIVENEQRIKFIESVALNPFWTASTNIILANYLVPDRKLLALELPQFEQSARWQPYPLILLRLCQLQALANQPQRARESLALLIANYSDSTPEFAAILAERPEPEIRPLAALAYQAERAYTTYGRHTDAGRLAAVMTVASPVTRKTLF